MPKMFSINRDFYSLESNGTDVELTLHGDVVSERPKHWDGTDYEGNFIVESEVLEDLKKAEGHKSLTIRLNSYGGDSVSGVAIHNRIRELSRAGVHTKCVIDAVAMSAGSAIACACEEVTADKAALFMIHKCWAFYWGAYNADELRREASAHDAYDKMYAEIYKRKSGLSEEEILGMMSETTYLTSSEALEKGFLTSVIEDENASKLAASADGRFLYAGNRRLHMCPGSFVPDTIPTISEEDLKSSEDKFKQPEDIQAEGGTSMTIDELREQYPDLCSQIAEDAVSAVDTTGVVSSERQRLAAIDEIADLFDADLVKEAKYGETACSAEQLALRAAQAAKKNGQSFLAAMSSDAEESGVEGIKPAPAPEEKSDEGRTPEQCMADARAVVMAALGKNKED